MLNEADIQAAAEFIKNGFVMQITDSTFTKPKGTRTVLREFQRHFTIYI